MEKTTLTLLRPADYVTTEWSGGKTTQLAIAPAGAVYADRDFLWRISSATVELDESDFTSLPDYRRFISTTRGDMILSHNGGAELMLHPGDVHEFDGGDATHSRGRCTDFNLMLRKGRAAGELCTLRLSAGRSVFDTVDAETVLFYCVSGGGAVGCGGRSCCADAGDTVLMEHVCDAALTLDCDGDALWMAARIWLLPGSDKT